MFSKQLTIPRLALLALTLPVAGFSTAIQIAGNGGSTTICALGTCPDPNATATAVGISPAPSSISGTLNYTYVFANGDDYSITGTYSANYISGVGITFSPNVVYTGNNGNTGASSAGVDTLTFDMFQNYYDNSPGVWSGQYCEVFGVSVAPLATATGNLKFDGQGIGTVTAGPGTSQQTACANLQFTAAQDASAYLNADYNQSFTFAAFTAPGTGSTSPPTSNTPEPSTAALGLLGIGSGLFAFLRNARRHRIL